MVSRSKIERWSSMLKEDEWSQAGGLEDSEVALVVEDIPDNLHPGLPLAADQVASATEAASVVEVGLVGVVVSEADSAVIVVASAVIVAALVVVVAALAFKEAEVVAMVTAVRLRQMLPVVREAVMIAVTVVVAGMTIGATAMVVEVVVVAAVGMVAREASLAATESPLAGEIEVTKTETDAVTTTTAALASDTTTTTTTIPDNAGDIERAAWLFSRILYYCQLEVCWWVFQSFSGRFKGITSPQAVGLRVFSNLSSPQSERPQDGLG